MNKPRFRIKLKDAHEKSGLTSYAVAKRLGMNHGTVRKYLTEDVEAEALYPQVLKLLRFYGLNWRDPAVIEVLDADEDEEADCLATVALNGPAA